MATSPDKSLSKFLDIPNDTQVTRLNLTLASGTEDSTCEATLYDPGFSKYLDSAQRYNLTVKLAGQEFKLQAQCDDYDFTTLEVTLTGNSPAWQYNLTPRYNVFQKKTVQQVLDTCGAKVDNVPSSILTQQVDLCQNNLTDYQFLARVTSALGLRLQGDLSGSNSLKVSADKGETVLAVTGEWFQGGCTLTTSNTGILVSSMSIRHADVQESAKSEPKPTPEKATTDSTEQAEPSEKFVRINPQTGKRFISKSDTVPTNQLSKEKAKARAIEAKLSLVVAAETQWLAQPGDTINLKVKDASGKSTELTLLVDRASYDFNPEYLQVDLSLVTSEKK